MTLRALLLVPAAALPFLAGCRPSSATDAPADLAPVAPVVLAASDVEAGRYLVDVGGCNDCHTAGYMEQGPAVPEAQRLTGMPVGFRGPWGTSYAKNLRLTVRQLTEDQWVERLQGSGLPPMPWPSVNALSEDDARAVYRYVRSLGEAGAPAPTAVPPNEEPATPYIDFAPQHLERIVPPTPADTATAS